MNRRQLLATAAVSTTAATAGCLETVGLKQERETDVDWDWEAYPAETEDGYIVFILGELENTSDANIHELEFTATLIDSADQQAEERTITDLAGGTTQAYHFRIQTSRSIATGDLEDVEFEVDILDAETSLQSPF